MKQRKKMTPAAAAGELVPDAMIKPGRKSSNILPAAAWKARLFPIGALILLFIVTVNYLQDDKEYLGGDNFVYCFLGKALATGKGYVDLYSAHPTPHNHFPPGYPFIISLFMRLGFHDFSFYSTLNEIFGCIIIILAFLLFLRVSRNPWLSFAVCFFLILSAGFVGWTTVAMSEIPCLAFIMAALYTITVSDRLVPVWRDYRFFIVLSSLVIAYYIRSSAISLLPALLIVYLLRRQWQHAATLITGFILSVVPWILRSNRLGGSNYLRQFRLRNPYRPEFGNATLHDYGVRIIENLKREISLDIPCDVLKGVFPDPPDGVATMRYWIGGIILLVLIIRGLILLAKKSPAIVTYFAGSAAILLVWPSVWYGSRFLVPLLPFILFVLCYALYDTVQRITQHKAGTWWPAAMCMPALLLLLPPLEKMRAAASDDYEPNYKSYFDAATWAKGHLAAGSVFACRKPEMFTYFSERKATYYLSDPDPKKVLANLEQNKIDYVILDPLGFSSTGRYLVPVIQQFSQRFEITYQGGNPVTYILKFKQQSAASPSQHASAP